MTQGCKRYAKACAKPWETKERMIAPPCARGHGPVRLGNLKKEIVICTEPGQLEGQIIRSWSGGQEKKKIQQKELQEQSHSYKLSICISKARPVVFKYVFKII